MGSTLEAQIVNEIRDWLESEPHAYSVNVWGNAHMTVGTPDILGCYRGRSLAIEVKRAHPTKRMDVPAWMKGRMRYFYEQGATAVQAQQLEKWEKAGALTLVATSLEEVKEAVKVIP